MTLAQAFLAEFDHEITSTRRHLECIPEDKLDWLPAPKSMTLGTLGLHIAASLGQIIEMATQSEHHMPEFDAFPSPSSRSEILDALDASVKKVHEILPTFSDEQMQETIRFMKGDQELASFPRCGLIRTVLLNHLYHHRGQMSVYLRQVGVAVPSTYGPTADEAMPTPSEVAS